jgi:hypothetical protein
MNSQDLHHLFECRDGVLYWKKPKAHRCKAGDKAGSVDKDGYNQVHLSGGRVPAHKIIWCMAYGEMPEMLDHINGDRADNRLSNLRVVTKRENNMNRAKRTDNKSGFTGVRWHKQRGKWNARIKLDGKEISLGMYESFGEAVNARLKAEAELFGEYSRILRQVESGELTIEPAE